MIHWNGFICGEHGTEEFNFCSRFCNMVSQIPLVFSQKSVYLLYFLVTLNSLSLRPIQCLMAFRLRLKINPRLILPCCQVVQTMLLGHASYHYRLSSYLKTLSGFIDSSSEQRSNYYWENLWMCSVSFCRFRLTTSLVNIQAALKAIHLDNEEKPWVYIRLSTFNQLNTVTWDTCVTRNCVWVCVHAPSQGKRNQMD